MKSSVRARLKKLEKVLKVEGRHKCATVVCGPGGQESFDFSQINADRVLIVPDNGNRLLGGRTVPEGTCIVSYG